MRISNSLCFFFLFISTALLLTTCSNPKEDYEPIQRLQTVGQQKLQESSDDVVKLKSCDDVIEALDKFIKDHPDGEWNLTAKTALATWQLKRNSVQENINRKLDFESVQKQQEAAEEVMQNSTDYTIRMKNCDDIITSLQTYIAKHPEGDLTKSAKTTLMSWQSRKATLEQELSSLSSKLYSQLQDRAIFEAQKVHRMSKVERIHLEGRKKETIGTMIHVTDIYAIRMRGTIIGKNIFKLNVTVSGNIDPATKQVFVDDKAGVDE